MLNSYGTFCFVGCRDRVKQVGHRGISLVNQLTAGWVGRAAFPETKLCRRPTHLLSGHRNLVGFLLGLLFDELHHLIYLAFDLQ